MRGARDLGRSAHCGAKRLDTGAGVKAEENERGFGLGARKDLERDFSRDSECPERAGKAARQIVARYVLDDPAARLESFAAAAHGLDAKHEIACAARLDPARPGGARHDGAADRPPPRAVESSKGHGLERKLLAPSGKQRLDLLKRSASQGAQHELLRLIKRNAR